LSIQCLWMSYVNIDHWILKLAYLTLQNSTEDTVDQVDISNCI